MWKENRFEKIIKNIFLFLIIFKLTFPEGKLKKLGFPEGNWEGRREGNWEGASPGHGFSRPAFVRPDLLIRKLLRK